MGDALWTSCRSTATSLRQGFYWELGEKGWDYGSSHDELVFVSNKNDEVTQGNLGLFPQIGNYFHLFSKQISCHWISIVVSNRTTDEEIEMSKDKWMETGYTFDWYHTKNGYEMGWEEAEVLERTQWWDRVSGSPKYFVKTATGVYESQNLKKRGNCSGVRHVRAPGNLARSKRKPKHSGKILKPGDLVKIKHETDFAESFDMKHEVSVGKRDYTRSPLNGVVLSSVIATCDEQTYCMVYVIMCDGNFGWFEARALTKRTAKAA
jgi:hypothetical protein